MTEYTDQFLKCAECKTEFIFTAGEQRFFQEKGFTPPKRCPSCRKRNKEAREAKRQLLPRGER